MPLPVRCSAGRAPPPGLPPPTAGDAPTAALRRDGERTRNAVGGPVVAAASPAGRGPPGVGRAGSEPIDGVAVVVVDAGTETVGEGGQPRGSGGRVAGRGLYHAVRVGYALASPSSADDDDDDDDDDEEEEEEEDDNGIRPNKKRKREGSGVMPNPTPTVKIHSAIFLYWEDASQFVDASCADRHTAHKAFQSFEEAEEYLLEGERENALNVAIEAEVAINGAVDGSTRCREEGAPAVERKTNNRSSLGTARLTVQTDPVPRGRAVPGYGNTDGGPWGNPHENPHGNPYGYGLPCGNPLGNPHGNPYGGPWGTPNPFGSSFGGCFHGGGGMGSVGPRSRTVVNNVLATAGQPVSMSNRVQTRETAMLTKNTPTTAAGHVQTGESTNDNGKENDLNIEGKNNELHVGTPNSKEGKTATPKSKGQNKPNRRAKVPLPYWNRMHKKLVEYKCANDGSIEIPEVPEGEKDDPKTKGLETLRRWCNSQAQHGRRWTQGYADAGNLTTERVEKLREVGFHAPSYDEMYEKLAARKDETGTLDVDEDEDEELFAWTKEQKKMMALHLQGKPVALSADRIQNLKSLGFEQTLPGRGPSAAADAAAAWNSMLEGLVRYGEDHGHFSFPAQSNKLPKRERLVKYWALMQRREHRKLRRGEESDLTARRLQRLAATGFDLNPRPEYTPWEQHLQDLREFVSEHGHCRPNRHHPLGSFVSNMRQFYRKREEGIATSLTDERVKDLEEIGFVFKAGKTPNVTVKVRKCWEERFQELIAFKEEHGHTIVPQQSGPLGGWVKDQRTGYKRMKAGQKTPMTAERALRLTEISFHFEASRTEQDPSAN